MRKDSGGLPEIIFEDDVLVVLNKPAGLLSIPDRFDAELPSLSEMLKRKYGNIFVVHRLDRDTSGVIVFAKDARAHKELNRQFESRETVKKYSAVVEGNVPDNTGMISLPLSPSHGGVHAMRVDEKNGKEALTEYAVLERFKHCTSVAITLHTGRQHQIRVHFSAIGHPLLVDAVYGNTDAFLLSSIKHTYKPAGDEKPLIARLTLHASEITFTHPVRSETVHALAPLPKDLTALLKQLGKWDS